jgi:hypothetical protein
MAGTVTMPMTLGVVTMSVLSLPAVGMMVMPGMTVACVYVAMFDMPLRGMHRACSPFRHPRLYRVIIVIERLTLNHLDRPGGAIRQAIAQPVAIDIAYKFGLAVDDLDSALMASIHADRTAIAKFLMYGNDVPFHRFSPTPFPFFTASFYCSRLATNNR